MHEHEENPHVGGAAGGTSHPTHDDGPSGKDAESIGSGDIEISLGVPVSEEEFRRLKEEANSPRRDGAEEVREQAQEDEGHDSRA